MDSRTKQRYQGYISTPALWKNKRVSPFQQIDLSGNVEPISESPLFENKRLGKLVEAFVFHQLKSNDAVSWICDNLQIQNGKITAGEIDALYYYERSPVHLEVAYKFYLFDTIEKHDAPLAYWIGPNRKDSLFYKLTKLHNKQLALLHSALAKPYLESYKLDAKYIKQQLCFRAQLFLPYHNRHIDISPLNSDCVAGFYLAYRELELFSALDFFIPEKLDWLVTPHHDVDWVDYPAAVKIIEFEIIDQRSPMVWVRGDDGKIDKCFIVFW